MGIANRLQMVIKMQGMTNSAFADEIGVQRSSISHVLAGRNKPSIDFIQKILITFPKVDANWLVTGKKVGLHTTTEEVVQPPVSKREEERPIPAQQSKEIQKRSVDKIVIFYSDGTYEEMHKASSFLGDDTSPQ